MSDLPAEKQIPLTDAQVKDALLKVFKAEIRDAYQISSYALTSNGKLIVKLVRKASA